MKRGLGNWLLVCAAIAATACGGSVTSGSAGGSGSGASAGSSGTAGSGSGGSSGGSSGTGGGAATGGGGGGGGGAGGVAGGGGAAGSGGVVACCTGDLACGDETYVPCVNGACKVPVAGGCWATAECPLGQACTGATVCPCGALCAEADRSGRCEPAPIPACCRDDAECPTGRECVQTICELVVDDGCWRDGDCNPGSHCQGAFVCPCTADCAGVDRPGQCVPDAPGCCSSDWDCGDYAYVPCVSGVCKTPVPAQCWSSAECPSGQGCAGSFVCPCGAACDAEDRPGTCEWLPD